MKKNFLFKGVSVLGAVLLLATTVMPGLQYAYADPIATATNPYTWEYIHDEASWNQSYTNGALKKYYEENPSEDLWNTSTNEAPGFNDKIYTVKMWTNAECEGNYETRQFKAQWYSDNGVQKIIDVNDNTIEYYLPTFFENDGPNVAHELFAGAEGGYVATPDGLVSPCSRWIKVDSFSYGGENVTHTWQGAVNAPGAKYPWAIVNIPEGGFFGKIKFEYEGKSPVYPWGEEAIQFNNDAIASIPGVFNEDLFLIANNGFDSNKFSITLTPAYTVTFDTNEGECATETACNDQIVDKGNSAVEPADPTKEGYVFLGWFEAEATSPYDFTTPVTADVDLTAKWASTAWEVRGNDSPHGTYTYEQSTDKRTLTVTDVDLLYPDPDDGNDRPVNPATWVGVLLVAPEAVTNENSNSATIGEDTVGGWPEGHKGTLGDGRLYVNQRLGLTPDNVKKALNEGKEKKTYSFNVSWNGTDDSEVLNVEIDITNLKFHITEENVDFEVKDGKIVTLNGETAYTITFNTNGGSAVDPIVANAGAAVTAPANPTKNGYTFAGWDTPIPTTMPAEDMTITAKWNKKSSSYSGGGGGSSKKTETKEDAKATTGDTAKVDDKKVDETKTDETKNDTDNEGSDGNKNPTTFSQEFIDAYNFAYKNGITTKESIEEADMFEPLTRIAMAKMLSQYAINVLGQTPDTTVVVPTFPDVDAKLDADYNNGVTLAYQLGIMGIGIQKFRPFDTVTRAEFGTALSRMLYGTADGEGNEWYSTHLQKLMDEKIITNNNPDLKELRGYVMIMLMRSAQ